MTYKSALAMGSSFFTTASACMYSPSSRRVPIQKSRRLDKALGMVLQYRHSLARKTMRPSFHLSKPNSPRHFRMRVMRR